MTDFSVPPEWLAYADQLDEIAATLRDYLGLSPPWADASMASAEIAQEADFSALPFEHPVTSALIHPLVALGQAVDHLAALAAVVRTERTVLAMFTLIRPILVAAGAAHYLADPHVDGRERLRRALNVELKSATEQMHFFPRGSDGFEAQVTRRQEIAQGARQIWRHLTTPDGKRGRVLDWHVGNKPLGDMGYVREALIFVNAPEIADTIYRLMSATTHAQPHALLPFLGLAAAQRHESGYASAPAGMDAQSMMLWLLAPTTALWGAVVNCTALYGWDPSPWQQTAVPRMLAWNHTLEQITRQQFIDRTGLWLP